MFNNCSNCEYGIEGEQFIECSIKDEIKNSTIEWYDGCPYFRSKTQIFDGKYITENKEFANQLRKIIE